MREEIVMAEGASGSGNNAEQDEERTLTSLEQARAAVEQARGPQQTDDDLVSSSVERLKASLEKVEDALRPRRPSESASLAGSCPTGCEIGPYTGLSRQLEAFLRRLDPAVNQLLQPLPAHPCNDDESDYQTFGNPFYDTFFASFSK